MSSLPGALGTLPGEPGTLAPRVSAVLPVVRGATSEAGIAAASVGVGTESGETAGAGWPSVLASGVCADTGSVDWSRLSVESSDVDAGRVLDCWGGRPSGVDVT
ncbi:MAG TPA: hypothetical protein VGR21_02390 [Cryptosporangiaceae bacterium]|nr:hypothetical protein [Cryptosporangiaceae bacterium]